MGSDEILVRRILHHSRTAADELFDRYYRNIYAYVYRQLGVVDLAQDLTQDIFLTVFTSLASFDLRRASFRTWLYRIASNKITDYYRSRSRREAALEMPIDDLYDTAADSFDVERHLENVDGIRLIMETVSRFEPSWAAVFQMKIFEDLTFSEIALRLGISENTAKSRYYTILRKIRKEHGYAED